MICQCMPRIRSNQLQETKEVTTAFTVARNEAMAQLKATCEQIHLNESFYKQALADQSQTFAERLRELFASRMQHAADVNFFTSALQENRRTWKRSPSSQRSTKSPEL